MKIKDLPKENRQAEVDELVLMYEITDDQNANFLERDSTHFKFNLVSLLNTTYRQAKTIYTFKIEITSRYQFGQLFEANKVTGRGAEIGVRFGDFSKSIGDSYTGGIFCVDLWLEDEDYNKAKALLSDSKYILIKGASLGVVNFIPDNSLDFVYIDANHHYKEVLADLKAWYPKVRSGGIVSGHDYVNYQDIEVIKAVDEFCKENNYSIKLTTAPEDYFEGTLFASWWFVKR